MASNVHTAPRKRKAIPKALRFEVFKRDKFACQYCGGTAPDVVLVIDHLHPHSKGGADTILNLITSCDPCNSGKGARVLSDDSVMAKQRSQLEQLQERRDQLAMMMEWQRGLIDLSSEEVDAIADLYTAIVPGWALNDIGRNDVRAALARYPAVEIAAMLRESVAKGVRLEDGRATQESMNVATMFFNELKYRKKRDADPVGSSLRYLRGIVRNRVTWWNYSKSDECLALLRDAHSAGHPIEELREIATSCTSWSRWIDRMLAL